jgi:hypothetical protein
LRILPLTDCGAVFKSVKGEPHDEVVAILEKTEKFAPDCEHNTDGLNQILPWPSNFSRAGKKASEALRKLLYSAMFVGIF